MLSRCCSQLTRWWNGQGAIRLEDESVEEEKEVLPLYSDDEPNVDVEETKDSYTQSRILLECVIASIWNGLCLLYLLVFPHIDPVTGETLSPKSGFVYILLALCTLPLIIGMCAGGEAMWGQRDEERQRRERRTRLQKFAVSFGFLSCCAGIGGIVAYIVRGQSFWLQVDLMITAFCVQALLLVQNVSQPTCKLPGLELEEEKLDVYEFLRESSIDSKSHQLVTVECLAPLP